MPPDGRPRDGRPNAQQRLGIDQIDAVRDRIRANAANREPWTVDSDEPPPAHFSDADFQEWARRKEERIHRTIRKSRRRDYL